MREMYSIKGSTVTTRDISNCLHPSCVEHGRKQDFFLEPVHLFVYKNAWKLHILPERIRSDHQHIKDDLQISLRDSREQTMCLLDDVVRWFLALASTNDRLPCAGGPRKSPMVFSRRTVHGTPRIPCGLREVFECVRRRNISTRTRA